MITENTFALIAYLAIVLAIAGPVIFRLVGNLRKALRIRKHKAATPGPLLGVIYPEHKNSTIWTINDPREDDGQ